MVEAARIDGAGLIAIVWLITLPIELPAFMAAWIFKATDIANDVLFPVTIVSDPKT